MSGYTIHTGDCLDVLRTLSDESVQCVVTSPPYFGLRDYGHEGQIGLEGTVGEYVEKIVSVFREVRRVLRSDGVLWLNIGDTYAAQRSGTAMPAETLAGGVRGRAVNGEGVRGRSLSGQKHRDAAAIGLKHKDLIGIPWRVALALQADGWWLRQDIIWHKPSPMPESVTDRCTKAHEYVFLLTKSQTYFFDAEAISEPSAEMSRPQSEKRRLQRMNRGVVVAGGMGQTSKGVDGGKTPTHVMRSGERRNRRSVWTIATRPYTGAHFATMPPTLAEACIKAGTSERGCCPHCGSPWMRITERTKLKRQRPNDHVKRTGEVGTGNSCANSVAGVAVKTLGWKASCYCPEHEPVPCAVLDPFAGSGTTLAVAKTLGRDSVGIELNPDYVELAEHRIESAGSEKVRLGKSCRQMCLFDEGSP